MVCTESKASMVIAGRGARACDMCGKERAKWYCAADEAYLCEKCDASVHSANSVARRHERVKLGPNGAPVKLKPSHSHHHKSKGSYPHLPQPKRSPQLQKWWNSTKKRSRTPRRSSVLTGQSMCAVISSINPRPNVIKEEKDDALLLYDLLTADYQLGDISASPPFDVKVEPFSPSSTLTSREFPTTKVEETEFPHEVPMYEPLLHDVIVMEDEDLLEKISTSSPSLCNASCNSGVSTTLKPDLMSVQLCVDTDCSTAPKSEPGAFDAESGSLFVNSVVEGSTADIHGNISISDDSDIDTFDVLDLCSATNMDDMQVEELQGGLAELDMWKDAYTTDEGACNSVFEGNPFKGKWEKEPEVGCTINVNEQWSQKSVYQNPLSLRLDYEDVISAWSDRGSLWMDGHRPQIVPDLSLLDHGCSFMIFGETGCNSSMCSQPGQVPSFVVTDRAREARVLRYKEKRRTRLFSKKIRYEVRKLNAERRPRMKGRFVKRSAIAAAVM